MRFKYSTWSMGSRRRMIVRRTDRTTCEIVLRRRFAICSERWEFDWIDGRSVRWRIPNDGESSGWEVAIGDGPSWTGAVHQRFWPSKSLGLVWTASDQSRLLSRASHLSKFVRTLEFESGRVIGLWTGCGSVIEGVIRDQLARDLGPVVLLMAFRRVLN